jgi:hypothetical protein
LWGGACGPHTTAFSGTEWREVEGSGGSLCLGVSGSTSSGGHDPSQEKLILLCALLDMSELSLRKYGYKVEAPKERRLYSLYLACLDYDREVVMERMKKLGSYHPVMMEDCEEYFGKKEMTKKEKIDDTDVVDAEVVLKQPLVLEEPANGTPVDNDDDDEIQIEIDDVQDACKVFCDLCSVIDETKAISFVEDAVLNITNELRIEDKKWQDFKDNFHAKRDKMVSEFNDFEKCMEVLVKDWNGESWLSEFLGDDFLKKIKENYEKTMKIMKKIELQSKKLKGRELHSLTTSKEIFEVRFLRTEMKVMCEELFRVFPSARFFNILKHTI